MLEENTSSVHIYQNELHQVYFSSLLDKLDELKLGRFKFSKNVCLDEIATEGTEPKLNGQPTFSGKAFAFSRSEINLLFKFVSFFIEQPFIKRHNVSSYFHL